MIRFIDYLREWPRTVRLLLFVFVVSVVVWSLTVDTAHGHSWAEQHIPLFWGLFGLVSAIVLIFVARWLAGAGIARKEDYYDHE